MNTAWIRVFIADNSQLFIQAVVDLLGKQPEIKVVGADCEPEGILEAVSGCSPDVILLDYERKDLKAGELIGRIKRMNGRVAVVALALCGTPIFRQRALKDGADRFVDKRDLGKELVNAIKEAVSAIA